MKTTLHKAFLALTVILLFSLLVPGQAQNLSTFPSPNLYGWQKITGETGNYSGVADGVMGDRENSYAWSVEFYDGYLYMGTMRNVIGLVLTQHPPQAWPEEIPVPTDVRGRIYRMSLATGKWEQFYLADAYPPNPRIPFKVGPDTGYRMMKTYKAKNSAPVLYVGGAGVFTGVSRLLAINSKNGPPIPIFQAPGFSIRALAEHNSQLFWASEVNGYPTIWYSSDPLKEFTANPKVQFSKIDVPADWFPKGAEVLDMVSWNNTLYVFFFDHDYDNGGFWCAKLLKGRNGWQWKLVVGDTSKGACYPKGMGRTENGGATPYVFKNKMYVGTISNTMWRFLNGDTVDFSKIPPTGTQIFRFDSSDKWERVMPQPFTTKLGIEESLNGFADPLNLYLWRFAEYNGKLYAGTFDARSALELVGSSAGLSLDGLNLWDPSGFDLYATTDGKTWYPETVDGCGDPWNYGARTLLTNPTTGDLYLGTANPFYGCQMWVKKNRR